MTVNWWRTLLWLGQYFTLRLDLRLDLKKCWTCNLTWDLTWPNFWRCNLTRCMTWKYFYPGTWLDPIFDPPTWHEASLGHFFNVRLEKSLILFENRRPTLDDQVFFTSGQNVRFPGCLVFEISVEKWIYIVTRGPKPKISCRPNSSVRHEGYNLCCWNFFKWC